MNDNNFHDMSTSQYMNTIASNAAGTYNGGYGSGYNDKNNNIYNTTEYDKSEDYTDELSSDGKTFKKEKHKKGGFGRFAKRFCVITASAILFGGVAAVMFNYVDDYIDNHNDKKTENVSEYDNYAEGNDYVADTSTEKAQDDTIETVAVVEDNSRQGLDVSDIADAAMPSIVAVNVKSIEEYNYGMFGGTYEYETEGSGSGIIIGKNETELLIVTNNHVVADAQTVSVTFIDENVYEAKVKGTDSDSDLAIIVVSLEDLSDDTLTSIKIAKLGNSDELKVGEQVVAIGNALGYGQSVTTGIISAVNRMNSTNVTPLIQTDAAINPGNSGGALINMNGEVIGINSSKYMSTQVEGMGYAIPISEVESILDELMNRQTREKVDEDKIGYLGVGCATIDEDISEMYGMPEGALISEVKTKSPAEKYGLKKNNIIVGFDGVKITSAEQLVDLLEYYEAGEKVKVTVAYLSDDEYIEKEIDVVLGRRAASE